MKALVTGATGFVGSTLCEELNRRGVEVRVMLRSTSSRANLTNATFTEVEGDLRSPEKLKKAVEGVDVIFHVAGVVTALTRDDFFVSNERGTVNLLDAVEAYNPKLKKFVYVSSLAAAGPSTPERPNLESDACAPISDYGASKLAGEIAVLARKEHLPVTVVRPPAVYGPRDRGVLTFFQFINKGVLPLLGTEQPDPHRYSFVHVEDLVQGIAAAGLGEKGAGEVYYLTGDGTHSWEEAMGLMAEGMEKKTWKLRLPIPLLRVAAAVCTWISKLTGKPLPFSNDKIKEIEAPAWTCANDKAKRDLGFAPYWGLKAGAAQTAKWYKENGWL
ncbi:MAG: NAD-dependent epimerase/dehydratase family protein [Proteobacteria bacterium]|nr:MAG: NAD-dependent epimerase/dehydratase family protein [Pseudomonadota bacterium]